MNTKAETQTALIFLILVAATVNGLRREYARMIGSKAGPRDNGYTSTFVETLEDYLLENFYGFARREQIRASRLQALRSGG